MQTVETVDISALFGKDQPARARCDQAIWTGLQRTGSIILSDYPEAEKVDARARLGLAFFDQPEGFKRALASKLDEPGNPNTYRGYHPHNPASSFRTDILDIGPDNPAAGPDLAGMAIVTEPTPWPKADPVAGWRDAVQAIYAQMDGLAKAVMAAIGRSAGFDAATIHARFDGQHSTLRFLDYPASEQVVGQDTPVLSAGRHTDAAGLSLLWQAGPGLQAEGPDGQFYDIPIRPNCISVHVGTVMTSMTDGVVPATPHRVLDHGVRRQSMGFFLEPALSAAITSARHAHEDVRVQDTYGWQLLTQLAGYGKYGAGIVAPSKTH